MTFFPAASYGAAFSHSLDRCLPNTGHRPLRFSGLQNKLSSISFISRDIPRHRSPASHVTPTNCPPRPPKSFSNFFQKTIDKLALCDIIAKLSETQCNQIWGYSSAGRALEWHSRGQRFDPAYLHQKGLISKEIGSFFFVFTPKIGVSRTTPDVGHLLPLSAHNSAHNSDVLKRYIIDALDFFWF